MLRIRNFQFFNNQYMILMVKFQSISEAPNISQEIRY